MQDVNVAIVTCGGVMMGDDGPWTQVRLATRKKEEFDIATKKEAFFEMRDVIEQNLGKSPIYEIPSSFDLSLEAGPSWKHGTLQ